MSVKPIFSRRSDSIGRMREQKRQATAEANRARMISGESEPTFPGCASQAAGSEL